MWGQFLYEQFGKDDVDSWLGKDYEENFDDDKQDMPLEDDVDEERTHFMDFYDLYGLNIKDFE